MSQNTEPTSSLLRRAAVLIRSLADAAVSNAGAWESDGLGVWDADNCVVVRSDSADKDPDLPHIALWSPPVARAVAAWLDAEAKHAEAHEGLMRKHLERAPADQYTTAVPGPTTTAAAALARLVLDEPCSRT